MSRNRKKRLEKTTYSIVVDGKTEIWYLQMMKNAEDLPRIDIKPDLPKKKKLKELFETVKENAENYDKVIWLVDIDTIISDNQVGRFGNYFNRLKKIKNISILANTPCLEYWYLLHFKSTKKYFPTCNKVTTELKKHLKDYEKTEKYYKNAKNNLYEKLKPYQKDALLHAQNLGDFDITNIESAKAEIYKIIKEFLA